MEKECQIVCEEKTVGTIKCSSDGLTIKMSDEGKEMCKNIKSGCCQ